MIYWTFSYCPDYNPNYKVEYMLRKIKDIDKPKITTDEIIDIYERIDMFFEK